MYVFAGWLCMQVCGYVCICVCRHMPGYDVANSTQTKVRTKAATGVMVWRTWCPAGDQCRKGNSQLGKFPTEEAARDALRNHLLRSSYHIDADTFSAAWVDEMMLQAEILEDDDTQDASAASATWVPPPLPPSPASGTSARRSRSPLARGGARNDEGVISRRRADELLYDLERLQRAATTASMSISAVLKRR